MKVAIDLLTFVLALNKWILDHQNSEANQGTPVYNVRNIVLILSVQVIEKY